MARQARYYVVVVLGVMVLALLAITGARFMRDSEPPVTSDVPSGAEEWTTAQRLFDELTPVPIKNC